MLGKNKNEVPWQGQGMNAKKKKKEHKSGGHDGEGTYHFSQLDELIRAIS